MSDLIIRPATPSDAAAASALIYDSSHELLDFLFGDAATARAVLAKLFRHRSGHFSHRFAHIAVGADRICGLELGYDRTQLDKQALPGSLFMLINSPISRWWPLAMSGGVIDGYVPKPSDRTYYINNIAISATERGGGFGKHLLSATIERARVSAYRAVELDVTSVNANAIGFYRKQGFSEVSRSGDDALQARYGLPPLVRMIRPLN